MSKIREMDKKLLLANAEALINKLNKFEGFLDGIDASFLVDEKTVAEIEFRLGAIKFINDKYDDVFIRLTASSVHCDIMSSDDFFDKYTSLSIRASTFLNSKTSKPQASLSSGRSLNARLPKIELPIFNGNIMEFKSYNEIFTALVHNNSNLTDIERFLHLKASLKGPAGDIISNMQPTGENYHIAFELLVDRYNNPKLTIQNHVKEIFDLKPITRDNAKDLRKLHDDLSMHLRALENFSVPIDQCVVFISHILISKFDRNTQIEFGKFKTGFVPTLNEINNFLEKRCQLLEEIDANKCNTSAPSNTNPKISFPANKSNNFRQSFIVADDTIICYHCNSHQHYIQQCPSFLSFSIKQRFDRVTELNLCKNCLRHVKGISSCRSKNTCRVCRKKHNSLLHFEQISSSIKVPTQDNIGETILGSNTNQIIEPISSETSTQAVLSCFKNKASQVLLSTAACYVKSSDNKWHLARVLLDSGSHANFITEHFASKLKLKGKSFNTPIIGINSCRALSSSIVGIQIASTNFNNFQMMLQCLTIPKIADRLPVTSFSKNELNIPQNVKLADQQFNISLPIDILIGASHFYNLLCIGQISLGKNMPILQKTLFGWVLSGNYQTNQVSPTIISSHLILENCTDHCDPLEGLMQKFWQLENVEPKNPLSKLSCEERFCEKHFIETVYQDNTERIVVSIPFKSNLSKLGYSKEQAVQRFLYLEKKLCKNPELRKEYSKFIHEYISLGHMTKITDSAENSSAKSDVVITTLDSKIPLSNVPPFYLPHHAVFKASSLTTKLRAVFDGSAKSTSGISINDTQIVGPVIQDDLFSILVRFRQHRIALTGDIEKMYRQILINPHERKFQRIVWRDDPSDTIASYELQTITYGTTSASFLATKCLQYLSEINMRKYPKAASILKSDFYMDDLLTGGDTVQEVLQIQRELTCILAAACFPLRKFLSNSSEVLSDNTSSNGTFYTIPLGERENAKTLGISWNAIADAIQYNVQIKSSTLINSKRSILSMVAQLFDPLALLSPIVIIGKLLIQKLWQLQLTWDDSIPEYLNTEWNQFKAQLPFLKLLKIPRCCVSPNSIIVKLHGFSDSSISAFGACIYIRCVDVDNNVSTRLLCSKSRVAPLHGATIPRLELCAAFLLTQLAQKVTQSLSIEFHKIFYWTDSTIVLNWINSAPNKYKTFVANRIASIQEMSNSKDWYHVSTEHNPADLITRGSNATNLINNSLWWEGPCFLKLAQTEWPSKFSRTVNLPEELKSNPNMNFNFLNTQVLNMFDKFSGLTRLQRVVAWIYRFFNNSKLSKCERIQDSLKVHELQNSLNVLVKLSQANSFRQELKLIQDKHILKSPSAITSLNPFLDETGILRVGGRIRNTNYLFNKKFPILLAKSHPFTKLIFEYFHIKMLHCGAQQLLACVREYYWPVAGRSIAKSVVHNCVKCFRVNPKSYNPLMADLPSQRLQANTPAFTHVGLDYAGPILINDRKTRGSKKIKGYICLFVCMVTRAIHLELVTDLCTSAFIEVLKRFISRRGKPLSISSDNAGNFVGAANELRSIYEFLKIDDNKSQITDFLAQQSIRWNFIIPRCPNRGGIWESGIKSTKSHLKRVLGNACLTYENFQTALCQIEAVLNSRPLSPVSTDPTDFNPLTPGHFLIGKSLCALPENNYINQLENRLSKYQRIQKLVQHFWKRWSLEIVPEMQKRTKWFRNLRDLIKLNSLVLVREDNLPPLQWALARVTEIHPSADKIPRSVTLLTANGNHIKRAVSRLCVLPTE